MNTKEVYGAIRGGFSRTMIATKKIGVNSCDLCENNFSRIAMIATE
jgi:hypothetical protein